MEYITLALLILFVLLNLASGIACFYILYYLVRNNRKKKALGISYNKLVNFFLFWVFVFCAFCESIFFFSSFDYLIQYNMGVDFSGGELFMGFIAFIFIGVVHACSMVILLPWYYYQKNLIVIADRKVLAERTKKVFYLATFIPIALFVAILLLR